MGILCSRRPSILTSLHGNSYNQACVDLAAKCDPRLFEDKFGAGISELQALVDAKTVTIARLLEILPADTLDQPPAIYDSQCTRCWDHGVRGGLQY